MFKNQQGIAHILLILLLLASLVAGLYLLQQKFNFLPKTFFPNLPFGQSKMTNVELKSEYKNPFKKETQYVNPFETYKNPFVVK